jgi:diguanylate cyclase (GGDEF)-like protein
VNGTYNYWLVALSLIVASLASYTALNLATRISSSEGRAANVWLIVGAFAMGTGIWAMHFIGMLAFSLPVPMGYSISTTLVSMAIAVAVSAFALIIVTRHTLGLRKLILGGVLMGVGICAMHYTGMAAMETSPPIQYEWRLFSASVVIAIVAAFAALWIAFTLKTDTFRYAKPASAVVMGLAITGMHYTGMAAAQFAPDTICLTGPSVDNSWMAGTIAGVTFLVLCVTLVMSVLDARHASETAEMTVSLQRANRELQQQALHDGLTGLPNRTLLEDRIEQAIEQSKRAKAAFAVLFVDLDRFKVINDSLGHSVGDEVLKRIAERLRSTVREEDTVSRLGGDEFVILLKQVMQPEDAQHVAEKIANVIATSIRVLEHEIFISPSVGVAVYPFDGTIAADLIKHADAAMYHVKKAGRNGVQRYLPEMATFYPDRVHLETDLRGALAAGELELFYQPKIDVLAGTVVGVEALIRWRSPKRGLVVPAEFIPIAEETGLIIPIGEWALHQACRQARTWRVAGLKNLTVAVNISAVQWRQSNFVDIVANALEESGLEPSCLELEITETVVMQNAAETILMLDRLDAMGVRLSIDDFGTGYSSLAYLKRFPLSSLKIDRAFINDLTTDPDDALITMAMINLSHDLKLSVVAEGVETEAQLNFLHAHGCDVLQGYYFSKPLDSRACEQFIMGFAGKVLPQASRSIRSSAVLLVDGSEQELEALEEIWRSEGFRTVKASAVENAYEILATDAIQFVVSEYHMATQNGIEFLTNVRRMYPSVIRILHAHAQDAAIFAAAINQAAVHKFLSKTWDPERTRLELREAFALMPARRQAPQRDRAKALSPITTLERYADANR